MSNASKLQNHKIASASDRKSTALWALLSFVVPSAVMVFVLMIDRIVPFGNGTLINKANAAWFESFSGLYRSVVSGDGVFYHLNVGFGSSFYPEFASGLCSPFLFLSLFFGQRSLAAAYSFITVIRAGAAGAASWMMLRQCTGAERPMCFAFSCGYSLCGFTAFAAYCPSVADGAVFLPLLVVGIFSYVQASRPVGLFVYGVLFFLTCPRLSGIGILFSFALYAAFYTRRGSRRQRVYKLAMFGATLLCAAFTNLLLVIPVWAGSVYYENGVFSDIKANDLFSDLCFGGYGTNPAGGVGLCLAGLLLIGFFAFFMNTKIGKGEKISVATGAALLLLCHAVPFAAKYILGFGNTGGEWVNAGFMFSLLAVYCTARNHVMRDGLKVWGSAAAIALYAVLAVLSMVLAGEVPFAVLAEAGLAVFACAVFVQLTVRKELSSWRLWGIAAVVLVLFGGVHCAGAVGRMESVVTAERVRFVADSKIAAKEELEQSYRENNEEIPRFYRTRSTDGVSDSVDINRNEVDGLTDFAERLGIMRASQYGGADNFTEFTDALFGIAHPDYSFYTKEDILHSICSPAYVIDEWDGKLPEDANAFELQNDLADKWFGARVFEKAEPLQTTTVLSSDSDRYKWTFGNEHTVVSQYVFELQTGENLYVLVNDRDYGYAVNSDARSSWRQACAGGIFNLSQLNMSDDGMMTVYLSSDVSQGEPDPYFAVYRGDLDAAMLPRGAQYISHRGSTVRFLFETAKAQTALTSLPFESGWDITVNGKAVKPVELCGGLIGIKLDKGVNSVVMRYTPPYFRTSFLLSAFMLAFGLYITLKIEHEAMRRRKVRMAFRAVEMNISRMTVDELDEPDEDVKNPERENDRENADDSDIMKESVEETEKTDDGKPRTEEPDRVNPVGSESIAENAEEQG